MYLLHGRHNAGTQCIGKPIECHYYLFEIASQLEMPVASMGVSHMLGSYMCQSRWVDWYAARWPTALQLAGVDGACAPMTLQHFMRKRFFELGNSTCSLLPLDFAFMTCAW